MPDHERLLKIADALTARTERGDSRWRRELPETYRTRSGEYELEIVSLDGDGAPPYRFALLDREGVELDSLSMDDWSDISDEQRAIARRLDALFLAARRSALGVDEAIAHVERSLGLA